MDLETMQIWGKFSCGRYKIHLASAGRSMRRVGIAIAGLTYKTASHDMTPRL